MKSCHKLPAFIAAFYMLLQLIIFIINCICTCLYKYITAFASFVKKNLKNLHVFYENKSMDSITLLNQMKKLMKLHGETQKELSDACDFALSSFQDWKNRGTIPSADIVYRIAKHYRVTMEYLLTGNDKLLPDDVAESVSLMLTLDVNKRVPINAIIKGQVEFWRNTNLPES